jgi:hypothetical protein
VRSVPIPSSFTKSDLTPIAVSFLLPAVLLAGTLTIPSPVRDQFRAFAWRNWGNIASVWGLLVSIYVLFVAKGARTAAREARLRTVLEDLADASQKCDDVGLFAEDQKWPLVKLRAAEVEATCRSITARWEKDGALKQSRNNVLQVADLMLSIVEAIDDQTQDRQTILAAQRKSNTKLAVVVGKMQGREESRST